MGECLLNARLFKLCKRIESIMRLAKPAARPSLDDKTRHGIPLRLKHSQLSSKNPFS